MMPNAFHAIVDRILHSDDPLEREHLYLGQALFGGGPILLSRELFGYHGIVRGGPGRGKTAFLERLVTQLIAAEAPERSEWLAANGWPWEPTSLLVIDLKGEMALFNTARMCASRAGIPFRFFTFQPGRSSHVFNFFEQSHIEEMSRSHLTQELLQALAAEYGQAYGASFFSSINEVVLLNTLRRAFGVDSFRKLDGLLSDPNFYAHIPGAVAKDLEDARHLTSLARRLSTVHALNVTRKDVRDQPGVWASRIDLPSLMRERQVVYFYLQPLRAETEAATVARLAIFGLITAAALRGPEDNHRVAVIADEIQTMATRNIARVLEHARSYKVPFVLAHQFRGQLTDPRGIDLDRTVEHCTSWSLDFEASSPEDIERIERLSLHGRYARPGWSRATHDVADFGRDGELSLDRAVVRDRLQTIGVNEYEAPIYDHNTILELSADPRVAWFLPKLRKHYTQYVGATPILWDFHVSEEEHRELAAMPWPEPGDETIVVDKDPFRDEPTEGAGVTKPPAPRNPRADTTAAIEERMRNLLGREGERKGAPA
jgi:hypothetical protein